MASPEPSRAAPSVGIRKAGPSDIPQISRVLARAFADDPVFAWVIPDESRRRRLLPALFALFANAVRHHDAMYIAGGAVAAALWVPAGQPAWAETDGEAFGALVEDVCGPDASRVFEISAAMEAQHPAEPHDYLWLLGVAPAWQGNGIGAAMMTPVLRAVRPRRQGGVPRSDQSRQRAPVRASRIRRDGCHRRARRRTALPHVA